MELRLDSKPMFYGRIESLVQQSLQLLPHIDDIDVVKTKKKKKTLKVKVGGKTLKNKSAKKFLDSRGVKVNIENDMLRFSGGSISGFSIEYN